MLIAGLLIAAVGIALSGYAGYRKDKGVGPEANPALISEKDWCWFSLSE